VQVVNQALDLTKNEEPFTLPNSPSGPLAVLAFKLEEGKYGQLTYVRVYSGTLQKGTVITNQSSGKRQKVPRLVRTHADEIQDTAEVKVIFSLLHTHVPAEDHTPRLLIPSFYDYRRRRK
jgi:translation elongation factor EF-G